MATTPLSWRRIWNSESSAFALRSKQVIASVLPERVLLELKKRYYLAQLRNDADETMEADAHALQHLVKPGDFVIDIGAFVGFYTHRLSRLVGPAGLVWSFEPVPPTFEILVASAERLGLGNVQFFPYAVSDVERTAVMEVPHYRGGGESWWDARLVREAPRPSLRRFEVVTRTLDALLVDDDRPVRFMKIDAEHHELSCIRGALNTLRRWHPAILVETLTSIDHAGSESHALAQLLRGLNYSPYVFDGENLSPRQPGTTQQNLFFL